jgi:hypothetical protein
MLLDGEMGIDGRGNRCATRPRCQSAVYHRVDSSARSTPHDRTLHPVHSESQVLSTTRTPDDNRRTAPLRRARGTPAGAASSTARRHRSYPAEDIMRRDIHPDAPRSPATIPLLTAVWTYMLLPTYFLFFGALVTSVLLSLPSSLHEALSSSVCSLRVVAYLYGCVTLGCAWSFFHLLVMFGPMWRANTTKLALFARTSHDHTASWRYMRQWSARVELRRSRIESSSCVHERNARPLARSSIAPIVLICALTSLGGHNLLRTDDCESRESVSVLRIPLLHRRGAYIEGTYAQCECKQMIQAARSRLH